MEDKEDKIMEELKVDIRKELEEAKKKENQQEDLIDEDNEEEIDINDPVAYAKFMAEIDEMLEEHRQMYARMEENEKYWAKVNEEFEERHKNDRIYQKAKKLSEKTRYVIAHLDEEKRERDEMLSKMTKEEFDAWYDEINKNAEEYAKENNIKAVEVDIDDKGNVVLNKKDNK